MKRKVTNSMVGLLSCAIFLLSQGLPAQTSTKTVIIKQLFPRNQTYEYQMLKALGFNTNPSLTNVDLNETVKTYAQLSPLEQAFGRLSLLAAEMFAASSTEVYDGQQMLINIANRNMPNFRPRVNGILAVLVMNEISVISTDPSIVALKKWSADLFRSMKVRSAKAILDEYQVWKNDPCGYKGEGYKPAPDCALKDKNYAEWFQQKSPPQDIIGKAGLKSVLVKNTGIGTYNADQLASVMAIGLSSAATAMAAAALTSTLGIVTGTTIINGVAVPSLTSLSVAFSGAAGGGVGASASGAVGVVGWAGVVAAPIAATLMAIVVGTMEGFRVVEAMKVEPMLKMKLGAAMTEHINITNVINNISAIDIFYIAFMESSEKGFQVIQPKIDGELRFYCQAGYVAKFKVTYSANIDKTGWAPLYQTVEKTTKDLPVGHEESIAIPFDAKNIKVQGLYLAGTWKTIGSVSLAAPTFRCYTAFGTIFGPMVKNDCPEVGNMVAKPNELTVTQGGGYTAWVTVTYTQGGKTIVAQDQKGLPFGWSNKYTIPTGATNINLVIKEATGLAWEPWKTVVKKSWPTPPNECIKVYGTTLDPKWNGECN